MKKNYFKMLVAVGLMVLFGAIAPSQVAAQSFQALSFLSGTNLFFTAGSTNSYGATNIYSSFGSIWGVAYQTNGAAGNTTNTQAIRDVPLFADRDGSFPSDSAFAVELVGINASFTNVVTFNFKGLPFGPKTTASTSAQNAWSFSMTGNGTNPVVLSTNAPTTVFQGQGGIRLDNIASATGTYGTNGYVRRVTFNGFVP